MTRFGLNFDLVESLTVNALSLCLRDEGCGVDHLDESEQFDRLVFLDHDHEDAHWLIAVASCAMKKCGRAVHLGPYLVVYLFRVLGDDEKLHRLLYVVHHVVEHGGAYEHLHKTEHETAPVVENEIGTADDDDVEVKEHAAKADVLVFVDNGSNDVGSACAALVKEALGQSHSAEGRADDHSHEFLSVTKYLAQMLWRYVVAAMYDALHDPQEEGERQDAIDGLEAEFQSEYLYGCKKQEHVEDKVAHLKLDACDVVDDGADAREAA